MTENQITRAEVAAQRASDMDRLHELHAIWWNLESSTAKRPLSDASAHAVSTAESAYIRKFHDVIVKWVWNSNIASLLQSSPMYSGLIVNEAVRPNRLECQNALSAAGSDYLVQKHSDEEDGAYFCKPGPLSAETTLGGIATFFENWLIDCYRRSQSDIKRVQEAQAAEETLRQIGTGILNPVAGRPPFGADSGRGISECEREDTPGFEAEVAQREGYDEGYFSEIPAEIPGGQIAQGDVEAGPSDISGAPDLDNLDDSVILRSAVTFFYGKRLGGCTDIDRKMIGVWAKFYVARAISSEDAPIAYRRGESKKDPMRGCQKTCVELGLTRSASSANYFFAQQYGFMWAPESGTPFERTRIGAWLMRDIGIQMSTSGLVARQYRDSVELFFRHLSTVSSGHLDACGIHVKVSALK
jgi:hypothetical protein